MKLLATAVALVVALLAADPINKKCPYTGKDVNAEKTSVYKEATVGFCCDNCKGKFDKAPDTEIKKVKEFKAKKVSVSDVSLSLADPINKKCPYTGKDVNAEQTSVYKEATVGFCCGNCKGKFDKAPDTEIKKVKEYQAK
jgi:endogenous inhibitor of DNA gyrase (YacG/DUF329 family)